jgi:hypothetical protein
LDKLKFFNICGLAVWVPDSGSVTHHRLDQGLVIYEERLLVMAPGNAADSLQEVEALRALGVVVVVICLFVCLRQRRLQEIPIVDLLEFLLQVLLLLPTTWAHRIRPLVHFPGFPQ